MHRLLRRAHSPVRARLAIGLGPQAHWSGVLSSALYVVVLLLLVSVLARVLPPHHFAWASQAGLLVSLAMVGLIVPLQLPAALWASRREQALLTLLPGAPRGSHLNRWLALRLAVLDLAVVLTLMAMAWVFANLTAFEPRFVRIADAVLAALALSLPLAMSLWRDWSRARAPSGLLQWGVVGASVAVGVLSGVWVYGLERPWQELALWTAAATVPAGAWRWRRLQRWPSAWPAGRIVAPRWRTPFDPPT
jgi:hypothetical protein